MATLLQVFVGLVLVMNGYCQSVIVEQADEDRAVDMIRQTIQDGRGRMGMNPAAKLIRLIFHDCVTGCDGCIDLDNPENNGLAGIFQQVNTLYDDGFTTSGMSRGDFYALAAVVAVREGSAQQQCPQIDPNCTLPEPDMFIRYGRKDCATSPNSTMDFGFPDAHRDLQHVMEIFRDGMGLTERQVVALIGAHTMGMTSPQNSGFQGPWAPPTNRFDNAFFRALMAGNNAWRQNQLNIPNAPAGVNPRFQWDNFDRMDGRRPPPNSRMMLNTDMALFKQVSPDETGRETDNACRARFTDCQPSNTADIVLEYARNNTRWHEDFGPAFQILLEHGYPDGHLVTAGEELPILVDPTVNTPDTAIGTTDRIGSAMSTKAALVMVAVGATISLLF